MAPQIVSKKNRDRATLEIVNTLFGGRFTSMLNDALRVNSGLTYGASAQLQVDRLQGAIFINTYTKTETTTQAIDMALDVLKRLNEKGITAEQLASAKAYVKGLYPTRHLETIDQLAAEIGVDPLKKGKPVTEARTFGFESLQTAPDEVAMASRRPFAD